MSNSYLPEQQLNFHNYLLFQTASTRTWAIPITIKSKPWEEKHFFKEGTMFSRIRMEINLGMIRVCFLKEKKRTD